MKKRRFTRLQMFVHIAAWIPLAVIIAALLGASSGYWLVTTLTGGE